MTIKEGNEKIIKSKLGFIENFKNKVSQNSPT
jgi:hypothetical protein